MFIATRGNVPIPAALRIAVRVVWRLSPYAQNLMQSIHVAILPSSITLGYYIIVGVKTQTERNVT